MKRVQHPPRPATAWRGWSELLWIALRVQLFALLLVGTASGCGDDQPATSGSSHSSSGLEASSTLDQVVDDLDQLGQTLADESRYNPQQSKKLVSLATRVERDCALLEELDPTAAESHCGPAGVRVLTRTIGRAHRSKLEAAGETSFDFDDAVRSNRGTGELETTRRSLEIPEQTRRQLVDQLVDDIVATSERMAHVHFTQDRVGFVEVEAQLRVYLDALHEAAHRPESFSKEPFALLSPDGRRHAHGFVKDKLRDLAVQPRRTPRLAAEQAVLEHYSERLEPLVANDAATFHLARDDVDDDRLARALADVDDARKREKALILAVHAEIHGPIPEGIGPDGVPPGPPDPDPSGSRSKRALKSLLSTEDRPLARLEREALLQAEFDALRDSGRLPESASYDRWRSSLLSPRDRAVVFAELHRDDFTDRSFDELRDLIRADLGEPPSKLGPTLPEYDGPGIESTPERRAKLFVLSHAERPHLDEMAGEVRKELSSIVQERLDGDVRDASERTARVLAVGNETAANTKAVRGPRAKALAELRTLAAKYIARLDARIGELALVGYEIERSVRIRTGTWYRALGGRGEPPGRASLVLNDGVLTELGAKLDAKLAVVEAFEINSDPVPYHTKAGRRVAQSRHLVNGRRGLAGVPRDAKEPRMPKAFDTYDGRRDPSGKFYDYESEVRGKGGKGFRTFKAVGGGIHMGSKATVIDESALDGSLVRYEMPNRRLRLYLADGRTITLAEGIEPMSMKALYRFVRRGANLAISIGHTGDDAASSSSFLSHSQIVLLDPVFVDTPVGQDLVLADKIPWDLDEPKLPNGSRNPIAAEFRRLKKDAFDRPPQRTLEEWLSSVPGLDDLSWKRPESELEGNLVIDAFFDLIVGKRDAEQALQSLQLALDEEDLTLYSDLVEGADDWSDAASRIAVVNFQLGRIPRRQARFFFAWLRADNPSVDAKTGVALIDGLTPTPTVATLVDDEVAISLSENNPLDARLRYFYAGSRWTIDGDSMEVKRNENGDVEAEHFDRLATLVTKNVVGLANEYHPLARVRTYAAICALLRLAREPREETAILLDLSALAAVDASSQKLYPTPDAIAIE